MKFILLINVKMPTSEFLSKKSIFFSILLFMKRLNYKLSWVEHEKMFYNLEACICFVLEGSLDANDSSC